LSNVDRQENINPELKYTPFNLNT